MVNTSDSFDRLTEAEQAEFDGQWYDDNEEERQKIIGFFDFSCDNAKRFITSGSVDALKTWIKMIADNYTFIDSYLYNYSLYDISTDGLDAAFFRFVKTWKNVKQACVKFHIIETPKKWYSKYQELNQDA